MRTNCLLLIVILSSIHFTFGQNNKREIGNFPQIDSMEVKMDSSEVIYKNKLLVFPLTALSTETSWVFGVANAFIFKTSKKDRKLRTSTMPSGFLYTLNKQILIGLGANIFLPKEKYVIRFENSFSKFPDKFWGIGNDTPEENKESYTFTQFYINPQLHRKIKNDFFVGAGWDYQSVYDISYDANGNFAKQQVLGIYNRSSYHVSGYSLFLMNDSRNHAYQPDKGYLLRIKFANFNGSTGSNYNFQVIEADYRKFINMGRGQTLAFQGLGTFTFGNVPYRNLAVLGGNVIMRGYYSGRYRDKKFIGSQVEYRFPIYKRVAGVGFASIGQVAEELNDLGFDRFRVASGAGLRVSVLPKEKLNLRFDVAYGNQINYYVVLAESF
jgi:hypothetical protein